MKKVHTRICAGLLAMMMCLSMSGCGSEIVMNKNDSSAPAQANAPAGGDTDLEVTAGGDSAGQNDTALPANSDPAYAYYSEMAARYDESLKYGSIIDWKDALRGSGYGVTCPVYRDGKIYFTIKCTKDIKGAIMGINGLYRYDIASKQLQRITSSSAEYIEDGIDGTGYYVNKHLTSAFIRDNDLYIMTFKNMTFENGKGEGSVNSIIKLTGDGTKIKSKPLEIEVNAAVYEIWSVFEDGKVLTSGYNSLFDADLQNYTNIVEYSFKRKEGEEYSSNGFDSGDGKKTCLDGSSYYKVLGSDIYEYNIETTESRFVSQVDGFSQDYWFLFNIFGTTMVDVKEKKGKTFDLKTGKDWFNLYFDANSINSLKMGEDTLMYHDDETGEWKKLFIPGADFADSCDLKQLLEQAPVVSTDKTKSQAIYNADRQHYLVSDENGLYLRSFEKGDSEQEVIVTKEMVENELLDQLYPKD